MHGVVLLYVCTNPCQGARQFVEAEEEEEEEEDENEDEQEGEARLGRSDSCVTPVQSTFPRSPATSFFICTRLCLSVYCCVPSSLAKERELDSADEEPNETERKNVVSVVAKFKKKKRKKEGRRTTREL